MIPINVKEGDLLKYVARKNITNSAHLDYFKMLDDLSQFRSDLSYEVTSIYFSTSGTSDDEDYVQWVRLDGIKNTFPIYIFEYADNSLIQSLKNKFKILQ